MSARPFRVLVVAASRHGATAEFAATLAQSLAECDAGRRGGIVAVAMPVEQRPDPRRSAPFSWAVPSTPATWLDSAREYAAMHADVLRTRPVWLFSSGPIGEPPFPPDEPYDVAPLVHLIGARGHTVFPGRLDESRLAFGERAMVTAMRAPLGDFRDWDAVRTWATGIAGQIVAPAEAPVIPGWSRPAPSAAGRDGEQGWSASGPTPLRRPTPSSRW